ncbi:MAG: DNA-binding domain-containing protein [Bacteroidota bacterium]|nr:DNA-binding domain-containing protein [Bacteroidota bacterium]
MSVLHKIKAWLYDNPLTEDPNDFVARVSAERSLSVREICESAVKRGGADVSAASMEHSLNLFHKEMAYLLCDGYSVNTEYYQASPLITGVFNSPKETFDPENHSISFAFRQGALLRNELSSVSVDILGVAENGSYIAQVVDVKTGSVNDIITPGRNLKVKGSKIKVTGEHEDVGIFFINQSNLQSTKVDLSDIVTNKPSELIIVVPTLTAGSYKLQVATQFTNSLLLKEPRFITSDKTLTVS